jgi:hypothetical protein
MYCIIEHTFISLPYSDAYVSFYFRDTPLTQFCIPLYAPRTPMYTPVGSMINALSVPAPDTASRRGGGG